MVVIFIVGLSLGFSYEKAKATSTEFAPASH